MKNYISFILLCNFILVSSQKIPILGFIGVPGDKATVENYNTMKDAGFTISLMNFSNGDIALNALNSAKAAGVKLILFYPQLHTDSKSSINKIKDHSALFGYFIGDEPSPKDFGNFNVYADVIKKYDNNHMFYTNLHPIYAPKENLEGLTYSDYIEKAVKNLPLSVISFDHYPIVNNTIRDNFYENLEIIKKQSISSKLPFWGFACSTIHFDYKAPTLASIKLQQFSNLLYGAQGLEYFTYWTMTSDINWKKDNYSYAIVDDNGKPTASYNIIKKVNAQIQLLASVFINSNVEHVYHTGKSIPSGTTRLPSHVLGFKSFSTKGSEALVSYMTNAQDKYIIIQNKSLKSSLKLQYKISRNMYKISNDTGKKDKLSLSKSYTNTILAGDILILNYTN